MADGPLKDYDHWVQVLYDDITGDNIIIRLYSNSLLAHQQKSKQGIFPEF